MGNPKSEISDMKQALENYLTMFKEYYEAIFDKSSGADWKTLQSQLQRNEPKIKGIIIDVLGNSTFSKSQFGVRTTISTRDLLTTVLMDSTNLRDWYEPVISTLERAIGTLDAGLWQSEKPAPMLLIRDEQLRSRCVDLLDAPGAYDRVIQEATRVLKDRIRSRVPHESLSKLIPNSGDQIGENLVNKVFSVDAPALSVSDDRSRRIAIRNILIGVVSYLRNPSHHHIDDQTEWSWAWSTVGLIDRLLLDIEGCEVTG